MLEEEGGINKQAYVGRKQLSLFIVFTNDNESWRIAKNLIENPRPSRSPRPLEVPAALNGRWSGWGR